MYVNPRKPGLASDLARSCQRQAFYLLLCLNGLFWGSAHAQQAQTETDISSGMAERVEIPDPEKSDKPRRQVDTRLQLELLARDGQDDDRTERDTNAAQAELTLRYQEDLARDIRLLTRLELGLQYATEGEVRQAPEYETAYYDLERAYLQQSLSDGAIRWRFGRQAVDDITGTTIDEGLDGLRLTARTDTYQLDLSYTREDWFDFSSEDAVNERYNTLVQMSVRPRDGVRWMPYALLRDRPADASGDTEEDVRWLGVQGIVNLDDTWRYWLDVSSRDGKDQRNGVEQSLGGHAVNLGLNWQSDSEKLVYTLGYARASDDYRQSGLHSNDFRLNRMNRFRFLGEALDPELANIEILTAGIGWQADKRWRGDLVLHQYQQVQREDNIRGSDLEFDPTGESADIGQALDLIIEYRQTKELRWKAKAGLFEPGKAFQPGRQDVSVYRLELDYRF